MAKKGAGEFVGDRCNHTAVFAKENERTSTREDDVGGLSLARAPLQYESCSSVPSVITG